MEPRVVYSLCRLRLYSRFRIMKTCYIERGWYAFGSEYWWVDIQTKEPGARTYNYEEQCIEAAKEAGYTIVKKETKC